MDKQCLFRSPTLISDTQEFQMTIFGGNPFNNPHRISEVYHLVASASIPYHGYEVSDAAGGPTAASMKCTNKVPVASVSRITGMFWEWLHFNNRCHLRCHQINHICDGITIHLTPESLQNRSFHLGSGSSRTYLIADTRPPRSQQRDQNCISASLSLSPHSIKLATPVDQSYRRHYRFRNLHEGTVPSTYRSTASISRNAPFLLLPSIAVHQGIQLHPSRP